MWWQGRNITEDRAFMQTLHSRICRSWAYPWARLTGFAGGSGSDGLSRLAVTISAWIVSSLWRGCRGDGTIWWNLESSSNNLLNCSSRQRSAVAGRLVGGLCWCTKSSPFSAMRKPQLFDHFACSTQTSSSASHEWSVVLQWKHFVASFL